MTDQIRTLSPGSSGPPIKPAHKKKYGANISFNFENMKWLNNYEEEGYDNRSEMLNAILDKERARLEKEKGGTG